MSQTTYSELLRDPRWQRKRLEIMERDNFTCQECGENAAPLNVHHCYYIYGNSPWDYPDTSLVTLCEPCHESENHAREAKKELIELLCAAGFRYRHFADLIGFTQVVVEKTQMPPDHLLCVFMGGYNYRQYKRNDASGGSTNSEASGTVPTGEGSSTGDAVERKSDAKA